MKRFWKISEPTNLFLEIINVSHLTAEAKKQRKQRETKRQREREREKYILFSQIQVI